MLNLVLDFFFFFAFILSITIKAMLQISSFLPVVKIYDSKWIYL